MIRVFTPTLADESITNAQALTVREIISRLDPDQFDVIMLKAGEPDPRIASRPNTRFIRWMQHGNTLRILGHCLMSSPDVYFYPREGPLDRAFFWIQRHLRKQAAVVTHVVSGGLDGEAVRPSLLRSIQEADVVFANSSYITELLRQRFSVTAETLHNGIDRRYFFPPEPSRIPGQAPVVLYAGSFRPYKRVDVVVRAAMGRPRVQFRIAGTGEEETACRRMAEGCQNVRFLGHLTQAELGDEMRRADGFFFPSVLEGHPQVLGQAAACGLPSVALKSYRPDYVRDGETGFLAGSHAEMEEKLDLLLEDKRLRSSMGAAAVQHSMRFDWDVIAKRWQEIFLDVASRRHRR